MMTGHGFILNGQNVHNVASAKLRSVRGASHNPALIGFY